MSIPFITKKTASRTLHIGSSKDMPLPPEPTIDSAPNVGQLPLDVLENATEIRIIAPLAGVDIDAVEIILNHDILTIKGERLMDEEIRGLKNLEAYSQECYWGPFSRSIILPLHADTSHIEATQKNHILSIRIPKKPQVQMRILKIQSK